MYTLYMEIDLVGDAQNLKSSWPAHIGLKTGYPDMNQPNFGFDVTVQTTEPLLDYTAIINQIVC